MCTAETQSLLTWPYSYSVGRMTQMMQMMASTMREEARAQKLTSSVRPRLWNSLCHSSRKGAEVL